MSSEIHERMRVDPTFRKPVAIRGGFAWTLSFIVLILFYGFVMAVAFYPATLGKPVSEGSMLTIGVAVELFLFVFFWALAALYVKRANSEFDAMTQEVIKQAQKESK